MGVDLAKTDHALYRFFGEDGSLLYVGISLHPFARMGQHRHEKSWWGEVATVTIERHPSRAHVFRAEREAIKAERPRYNVVHASARQARKRIWWRFSYWEPAVGRVVTVYNVAPRDAVSSFVGCHRCGRQTSPAAFIEMPHGEVHCEAKCPECGGLATGELPPLTERLVKMGGS